MELSIFNRANNNEYSDTSIHNNGMYYQFNGNTNNVNNGNVNYNDENNINLFSFLNKPGNNFNSLTKSIVFILL